MENNHNGIQDTENPMSSSENRDKKTLKEKSVSKTRLHEQAYSEQMELDFLQTCYTKVKYNFYVKV